MKENHVGERILFPFSLELGDFSPNLAARLARERSLGNNQPQTYL